MRSFTFGLVVGIVACLLAQRLLLPQIPSTSAKPNTSPTVETQSSSEDYRPNIDFYTRLRDSEILVPVPAPAAPREEVIYFLQAASFRNLEDANRARAEILLLNMQVEITEFHNDGETWHRIIVGPFSGQSMVSKAQTTLLENGYGGMVLQRKKAE